MACTCPKGRLDSLQQGSACCTVAGRFQDLLQHIGHVAAVQLPYRRLTAARGCEQHHPLLQEAASLCSWGSGKGALRAVIPTARVGRYLSFHIGLDTSVPSQLRHSALLAVLQGCACTLHNLPQKRHRGEKLRHLGPRQLPAACWRRKYRHHCCHSGLAGFCDECLGPQLCRA